MTEPVRCEACRGIKQHKFMCPVVWGIGNIPDVINNPPGAPKKKRVTPRAERHRRNR